MRLLCLFLLISLRASAQFIPSAIPISVDTVAYMTGVNGQWYKIIDADLANNPDSFPVYIDWRGDAGFAHQEGLMELPCAFELCPVKWSTAFLRINEFRDIPRNIWVRDHDGNTGGLNVSGNAIKAAIRFTDMAYQGGLPQWQDIQWDGCSVNYPDDIFDLEYVTLQCDPSSVLILGDSSLGTSESNTTLYYAHLSRHAQLKVGYGSILVYQLLGIHANVEYGKYCYMGRNQGLGVGTYYSNFGMHSQFICGDSANFDSTYIVVKDAGKVSIGKNFYSSRPIVVGEQSRLTLGDNSTVNANMLINSCASFIAGKNFTLNGHLSVEDFVYINNVGDSVTWTGGTVRRDGSTVLFSWNVGSDTTPDAAKVKWGNSAISCDGDTLTITSVSGLRSNCEYEYTAAGGKTIIFQNSSFFKMQNGVDFICSGADRIRFKTNTGATMAHEIIRTNY